MSVAESLAQPLSTLAFCWRLERRDGVTIGLTSHDRDLWIGGLRYRAAPGMTPSAIRAGIGLEPDGLEIEGALSADAIAADDLATGRWDGAALTLSLTQWEAPGEMWLELARGTIGGVERRGAAFAAELTGAAAVLDAPVAPVTTPDCRAELGDRDCRVDLARRRRIATVSAVEGERVTLAGPPLVAGVHAFGTVRWMSGAATGIAQAVIDNDAGGLWLSDGAAGAAGDLVLLTEGCDKRLATCAARFGNVANFRGEPWLRATTC